MGAAASVSASAEDVVKTLVAIDESFSQYSDAVMTNNIDGTVLQTLTSDELIRAKFTEIGVTEEEHLAKISSYLMTSHCNSAFLFIKPHANNEATQNLVRETLTNKGFSITSEGEITAEDIDAKQLIDNHYYSIAAKATLLEPKDLNVPADKFEEFFKEPWETALANESVYNALGAAAYLELDAKGLEEVWRRAKGDRLIKFGGGFYCAKIDDVEGKKPIYVFNAFFMSMRADFVVPGSSIHYFVVDWNPSSGGEGAVSWKDFRANVLGSTDPSTAAPESLRGLIMAQWESLGLTEQPSTGKNGVHGSASPLEGLGEKCNWLGTTIAEDPFGKSLIHLGVPEETVQQWCKDCQVEGKGSVFDFFEDTDVDACYAKAKEIMTPAAAAAEA